MQTTQNVPAIFANTGVQILCFPLRSGARFSADQVGYGWQRCLTGDEKAPQSLQFIQWQIVAGQNRLLLAIDTTVGPDDPAQEGGFFCKQSAMQPETTLEIARLLGRDKKPLPGVDPVAFIIRSAVAEGGEPKDVHLVVDFGNNRTGGLLIEFGGDVRQEPLMNPLQIVHRYHLDAWDDKGELRRDTHSWWFSSRSHWCTQPYLDPPTIEREVYEEQAAGGWFGGKKVQTKTIFFTPPLFQDFSQVRLGQEAHDLSLIMKTEGEVRTGLSSPKRYLWAKDGSWLEGSNWYMADPSGRVDSQRHAATLRGPMLRYLPEDDQSDLPEPEFDETPVRPRHAPRTLMTAALYEILSQAYMFVNSPTYRRAAGDSMRMRRIQSLTLTYPSGMIATERDMLGRQARNAARIFSRSAGVKQQLEPDVHLSIDEASAVHLTYIWSEIQKLGRRPSLWFDLLGRHPEPDPARAETAADEAGAAALEAEKRSSGPPRPVRPGRSRPEPEKSAKGPTPQVNVACIDIGGGTTDLMIARYTCDTKGAADRIFGETLHRDGIYLAGDYLVKRLLERIIVPHFAETFNFEPRDVQRFFGPETPFTIHLRAQRVLWMNRLFVPLAQRYLQLAVDEIDTEEITHTDDELVAPDVLTSLQETLNKEMGAGNAPQILDSLNLYYDRERFDDIVHEVFGDLLFDFCESIVKYQADVVLLAGLPTKLRCIRELVETYLPIPKSRIIPMYNRYVGTWYPYQNPDSENPGVIVDPKSTVVVGAAIEFASRNGMLSQFRFKREDKAAEDSYYWGVMTDLRIDDEKLLLKRAPEAAPGEAPQRGAARELHECQIDVISEAIPIGRKRRESEKALATPVYVIKVHKGQRSGEIDLRVTLRRERENNGKGEEKLVMAAVEGTIAGQPVDPEKDISFEPRTLVDERYYLDVGGLDKIELGT